MIAFPFRALVWALSASTDLVGIQEPYHARRTAYFAREIALHLRDLQGWDLEQITMAALLHDLGVSSTEIHERLISELEWPCVMSHCQKGYELLSSCASLAPLAEAVRLHHKRWDQMDRLVGPSPDEWLGNLIFLADRLDMLSGHFGLENSDAVAKIVATLRSCGGQLFNPEFVHALEICAAKPQFWQLRDRGFIQSYFKPWLEQGVQSLVYADEVEDFFVLFGQCVDGKSHFLADHSGAVALLAEQIALWSGMDASHAYKVKLAAYVHDIGKLRVPDHILFKPESLDPSEFALVQRQGFDAYEILARLPGFEEMARWVALHNERLDGSGYPYALAGDEIPQESRILALADLFQAMAQNRPYRRSLDCRRIIHVLGDMAQKGKIDAELYQIVLENQNTCMDLAYTRQMAIASIAV